MDGPFLNAGIFYVQRVARGDATAWALQELNRRIGRLTYHPESVAQVRVSPNPNPNPNPDPDPNPDPTPIPNPNPNPTPLTPSPGGTGCGCKAQHDLQEFRR